MRFVVVVGVVVIFMIATVVVGVVDGVVVIVMVNIVVVVVGGELFVLDIICIKMTKYTSYQKAINLKVFIPFMAFQTDKS